MNPDRPSYTIALPIEVGPDGGDYLPKDIQTLIQKTAGCIGAEFHGAERFRPVIFFFEDEKAKRRMKAKLQPYEP